MYLRIMMLNSSNWYIVWVGSVMRYVGVGIDKRVYIMWTRVSIILLLMKYRYMAILAGWVIANNI